MFNHHIIDMTFDTKDPLLDMESFKQDLLDMCQASGVTVMNEYFHKFGQEFGYTGVVCLAESHVSVHTWPEHDKMAVDVFICNDKQEKMFMDLLFKKFSPKHFTHKTIKRFNTYKESISHDYNINEFLGD